MKKMYIRILFCLYLTVLSMQAFSQSEKYTFSNYATIAKIAGVAWKYPKGFVDLQTSIPWTPRGGNTGIGMVYVPVLQSKDSNFLVMYSNILLYYPNGPTRFNIPIWHQLNGEMEAALGLIDERGFSSKEVKFDFDKYVTVLTNEDAPFRADTVFIAEIPLPKPYKEKYLYCTGIYACKQGRPSMMFKCFFTEEGKKNKNGLLTKFYKTVRYLDDNWRFNEKKYNKEYYKLRLKRWD